MRIVEITAQSTRAIKQLQRLYTSYILNPKLYITLIESINAATKSTDIELQREATLITEKLKIELLEILKV